MCFGRSEKSLLPPELSHSHSKGELVTTRHREHLPPRWALPERSGILSWTFLIALPSLCYFALVSPTLLQEGSASTVCVRPTLAA